MWESVLWISTFPHAVCSSHHEVLAYARATPGGLLFAFWPRWTDAACHTQRGPQSRMTALPTANAVTAVPPLLVAFPLSARRVGDLRRHLRHGKRRPITPDRKQDATEAPCQRDDGNAFAAACGERVSPCA